MRARLIFFILIIASAFSLKEGEVIQKEGRELKVKILSKNILTEKFKGNNVVKKDNEEEFEKEFNMLPVKGDMQKLTEAEVHYTPEIIKDAAEVIGRIHSDAQNSVAKRAPAMNFFKSCAEDRDIVKPIRAVCLKKIYKLMPEWKIATVISHDLIPESVSTLAFKLP